MGKPNKEKKARRQKRLKERDLSEKSFSLLKEMISLLEGSDSDFKESTDKLRTQFSKYQDLQTIPTEERKDVFLPMQTIAKKVDEILNE